MCHGLVTHSLRLVLYKSEMTTSPAAVISQASEDAPIAISAQEQRRRWFEVGLVLLVAFGRTIFNSIYLLIHGPNAMPQISSVRWAGGIVHEVTALLLLGYVLSRRGRRFADLGFRWSLRDLGVGLLVTAMSYASYAFGAIVIQLIHHLAYGTFARGPSARDFFAHPSVMFIPFSLLNPFFEELIVRAYLITEVIELTGSSVLAVALSVAVQFSYHLYYGWAGALSLSFPFLAMAVYYLRSRRIVPVIVTHAFSDIYALIRLW